MTFAVTACAHSARLDVYLRLVGQEGDVDLRQSLGDFGSAAFHQLIEERIGAGWRSRKNQNYWHKETVSQLLVLVCSSSRRPPPTLLCHLSCFAHL